MRAYYRLVARHPVAILLAIAVLTLISLHGIVDLRSGEVRLWIDPSVNRLLPEEDEDVLFYEHVRRVFGNDEILLVAIEAEDIYQPDVLRRLKRLTERLEALEDVDRVVSLATALDVRGIDGDLQILPFLDELPTNEAESRALEAAVTRNPIFRDILVSEDARGAALLVYFREISDRELIARGVDDQISAIVAEESGDLNSYITGTPHVKVALNRVLVDDLVKTLPLVFVVAALVLAISFRSFIGVVLPIATIGVALIWTLGFVGWIGWSLNLVTAIVPPLVVTVGFAYAIHVVSEYFRVQREAEIDAGDRKQMVYEILDHVGLPVWITGFTTIAGFLSLALNPMGAVREFGVLAVVGVVCTVSAALSFTPAVLGVVGRTREAGRAHGEARLDAMAVGLAVYDLRNRRAILGVGAATLVLALLAATQIRVGTEYIANFDEDASVRRDYMAIGEIFEGSEPFYVIFESSVPDAFAEPENLAALLEFQEWLEAQPEIASTTSLVDYLMLLNREMSDGEDASYAIPSTKRMAKQIFLFGSTEEARSFVDSKFQTTSIFVRARAPDSAAVSEIIARVEKRLEEFPDYLHPTVTGDIVLLNRTIDDIVRGQVRSIVAALGIIYLILSVMFTSARIGLVALFPNVLPIAVYFGALGISGVTLNPSTSLIACIALGIAVDDTVHYLARFNIDAKTYANEVRATIAALRSVVRPVTATTAGLCLGFLVLTTSDLKSQAEFGVLAAVTLFAAWLVDVTLTPALCSGVKIVTLWDVLTLDLGREPHRTIPLFDGLSARQARIFALLSRQEHFGDGELVFAEGDEGDHMCLIIDGSLSASIDRDGTRRELARMNRGDVVGEVALFTSRRSADVYASSDARVLSFGESDLARLARRYPRIAAAIYRNLNRVQATRIMENTQRAQ